MGIISERLSNIEEYLISIQRNTIKDEYEITLGVKSSFYYKNSNNIEVVEINKNDKYVILLLKSAYNTDGTVSIDDLIEFFESLLKINKDIYDRELKFKEEIENIKMTLDDKTKEYNNDKIMLINSINNTNNDNININNDIDHIEKRGRKKNKSILDEE